MVRYAEAQDYAAVEKIMVQAQNFHADLRPDLYERAESFVPEALYCELADKKQIIVAVQDEQVVGVAIFTVKEETGHGHVVRKVLYVDSMAVEEKHRGRGIGHSLFDFIRAAAVQQKAEAMELQVTAGNDGAIRMYKEYGFLEENIKMELKL